MEARKVGVGDGVDEAGDDTIDVGGVDAEGGDTREHITSSHKVVRE